MEYLVPASISGALRLLSKGAGVRLVAGGTDLAVAMADGLVSATALIDVTGIKEMRGIRHPPDGLSIGAATAVAALGADDSLPACLRQGALAIGSPQIRNLATVGGNICNASPCGDTLAPLIALDALFVLASTSGRREVPADSFFLGPKKTVLAAGELLVEVRIPRSRLTGGSAFRMIGKRNGQAISQVNAAAWLSVEGGRISEVRAAVGSVAPIPLRLRKTEELLRGVKTDAVDWMRILAAVDSEISPISDVRASVDYRRLVTGALFRDCLQEAIASAGGST